MTTCAVCGGNIRWDTEHYDQPRWVHVHITDTVACLEPGDIRPARPQRCLNCGARRDETCQTWCAYKPAGRFVSSGTGWPVSDRALEAMDENDAIAYIKSGRADG